MSPQPLNEKTIPNGANVHALTPRMFQLHRAALISCCSYIVLLLYRAGLISCCSYIVLLLLTLMNECIRLKCQRLQQHRSSTYFQLKIGSKTLLHCS
jgi:hypothetical protein